MTKIHTTASVTLNRYRKNCGLCNHLISVQLFRTKFGLRVCVSCTESTDFWCYDEETHNKCPSFEAHDGLHILHKLKGIQPETFEYNCMYCTYLKNVYSDHGSAMVDCDFGKTWTVRADLNPSICVVYKQRENEEL